MVYKETDAKLKKGTQRPFLDEKIGRFGERLEIAIQGSSVRGFAAKTGLSEGTLRVYLRGKTFPTLDRLDQISRAAGVSVEWLATGEGPMRPGEAAPSEAEFAERSARIPFLDVEVSAGGGAVVESEDIRGGIAFDKRWISAEIGASPRDLVLIIARGDSMQPTIGEGAILLVDTARRALREDGIYVIRRDHLLGVKRLQHGAGDAIIIMSDNPAYASITVAPSDLDIVGRVVWVGAKI